MFALLPMSSFKRVVEEIADTAKAVFRSSLSVDPSRRLPRSYPNLSKKKKRVHFFAVLLAVVGKACRYA